MADENCIPEKLTQNKWFVCNVLTPVFEYLEVDDIMRVARVCKLWNWLVTYNESILFSKSFATCEKHLGCLVKKMGDRIQSIEIDGIARATTRSITKNLRKMTQLRKITFADCLLLKLDALVDCLDCTRITTLVIEQTYREFTEKFHMKFIEKFPNLTDLGLMTFSDIAIPSFFASLKRLKKLTHLSLYDTCYDLLLLKDLTTLKFLKLGGETPTVLNWNSSYVEGVFKNHLELRKIKLEIYPNFSYRFFKALNKIPNLIHLELNGEVLSRPLGKIFVDALAQCTKIKVLTIELDPEFISRTTIFDYASRNTYVYRAVGKLKNSLKCFYWLIPLYYVRWTHEIWERDNCIILQKSRNHPRAFKDVKVLAIEDFQRKIEKEMPMTKVHVMVHNYVTDYRHCPKCKPFNC